MQYFQMQGSLTIIYLQNNLQIQVWIRQRKANDLDKYFPTDLLRFKVLTIDHFWSYWKLLAVSFKLLAKALNHA